MVYSRNLDCRTAARRHCFASCCPCQGLSVSGFDSGQSGIAMVAFSRRTVEAWLGSFHPYASLDGLHRVEVSIKVES